MSTDCLTLEQLTQQLVLRGIALSTINEKLIVDDPAERLTPILDRAIRQHREALLCSSLAEFPKLLFAVKVASLGEDLERVVEKAEEALAASKISTTELESLVAVAAARSRQIPYSVEDMPLDQFAQSGLARRVRSRVLGEDVLFAADNAQIPEANNLVVYRAAELQTFVGASPDMVKAVHSIKKQLDGEVIDPAAGSRRDAGEAYT